MISKVISIDIVNYLLAQRGYSQDKIAQLMDITPEKIVSILNHQDTLDPSNMITFTKNTGIRLWEIIYEGVPKDHHCFLPKESIKKFTLCKQLSDALKRKKK